MTADGTAPLRVRWHDEQRLRAGDLTDEQTYHAASRHRHAIITAIASTTTRPTGLPSARAPPQGV